MIAISCIICIITPMTRKYSDLIGCWLPLAQSSSSRWYTIFGMKETIVVISTKTGNLFLISVERQLRDSILNSWSLREAINVFSTIIRKRTLPKIVQTLVKLNHLSNSVLDLLLTGDLNRNNLFVNQMTSENSRSGYSLKMKETK